MLSLVIAAPSSAVGHILVWLGGVLQYRQFLRGLSPVPDPAAVVVVLIGLALVATAVLSAVVSAVGVLVVGGVHLVAGLLFTLVPANGAAGSAPFLAFYRALRGLDQTIADGMSYSAPTGVSAATGVVLLAAGFTIVGRRRAGGPGSRIAAVFLAVPFGVLGLGIALTAGDALFQASFVLFRPDPPLVAALGLLGGLLVLGGALATLRWSSLGGVVFGSLVVVAGLAGLLAPGLFASLRSVLGPIGTALFETAVLGNLALIGVAVVAGSLAVAWRGHRRGAREARAAADRAAIDAGGSPERAV